MCCMYYAVSEVEGILHSHMTDVWSCGCVMSRLASFKGPSTPSASPAKKPQPASPARPIESTYHRKTRAALLELRALTETWDDLVLLDSLKAARGLVDARTDLDNALALVPDGEQPRTRLVGPKLALMDKRIAELDAVTAKLQKQFRRMNTVIDGLDLLLVDAHKTKGCAWVTEEPLWVTWSLDNNHPPLLLPPYHRALHTHAALVDVLRSHAVSFEDARDALAGWPGLEEEEDAWEAGWEDLCVAEVGGGRGRGDWEFMVF
ncbi:hypothetical protein B0H12DRAFT_351251 [Mycena haematopus]|nr:hypothetical protein B0H12DRAFT_351251 [Mycena haematopus]